MKIKKESLILVFILVISLAIRIFLFINEVFIVTDAVYYSHLGKNLIETGRYAYGENFNLGIFLPPGYPVLIGLTNLFVDDLFSSSKLVSLIASMITVFLFYLIGKEIYNVEAGLFAAFAYGTHPLILRLSVFGNSEASFLCLLFLSIYIFIALVRRGGFLLYALFGILGGMSYLVRPEGLVLLILPLLHLAGLFGGRPRINKAYVMNTCFMVLVFGLVISPYVLFLKNSTGKFTLTGKSKINLILAQKGGDRDFDQLVSAPGNPYDRIAFSLNESKTQVKGFDTNVEFSAIDYVLKDPFSLISRYQRNILRGIAIIFKLIVPILIPLFFTFFYKDLFRNRLRLIFLIMPLLYFSVFCIFYIVERHMTLIFSFLILFSSIGFVISDRAFAGLLDFYGISRDGVITSFLTRNIKYIIVAVLLVSAASYLKFSNIGHNPIPVEHLRTASYLKDTLSPGYEELNIMARKPYVSFYSGSRFTMLPYAGGADVIAFAKLYDVDYIVVDERFLGRWDFYDELLHMEKYPDDVKLVYEDDSGKLIKLYKVEKFGDEAVDGGIVPDHIAPEPGVVHRKPS